MKLRPVPWIAAVAAGAGVFSILRWLRLRREDSGKIDPNDHLWLVDEAGEESFPASDPPSWTLGHSTDG